EQALRDLPIPVAAVARPAERINDPAHQGLWPTVTHSAMGEVVVDGQPVKFSATPWRSQQGAPCLSEHTRDVLTRLLGYSDEEVTVLYEEGVL
ncbi:MAG: CoA transferase, partial [Pseudomonadales bacterium]